MVRVGGRVQVAEEHGAGQLHLLRRAGGSNHLDNIETVRKALKSTLFIDKSNEMPLAPSLVLLLGI